MILFTQSTAVLHKYLNDEIKILFLLQFFPKVAQNSPSFPCSEKSLSIPGFPGLWPPCSVKARKKPTAADDKLTKANKRNRKYDRKNGEIIELSN